MTSKKIAALLKKADIELVVEQDDIDVRGNALASGDEEADRAAEDEILERLERGDIWAWASVKVVATLEINDVQHRGESNWLGCCSYEDERAFCRPGGYFDDMKNEALAALATQIQNATDRQHTRKKLQGIESLRRAVNLFNNCNEDFNCSFTAEELVKLHDAYVRSGWDITPDRWTDRQVKEALEGKAPNWYSDNEKPKYR